MAGVVDICIRRRHLIWLDVNCFGLCESVEADTAALRAHSALVAMCGQLQFAASFGLHLQDAGCVICVCESSKEAANVRQTLLRCASELMGCGAIVHEGGGESSPQRFLTAREVVWVGVMSQSQDPRV